MAPVFAVVDINVLVDIGRIEYGVPGLTHVPGVPPISGEVPVDLQALRVLAERTWDGHCGLQMVVSRHILNRTRAVLIDRYEWEPEIATQYILMLVRDVGGGSQRALREPDSIRAMLEDTEDDQILSLALDTDAQFIVTENVADFERAQAPVEIRSPTRFLNAVDGARRRAGWRGRRPPAGCPVPPAQPGR